MVSAMTAQFDFRGFRCVASPDDARSWEYLPYCADLRRDADDAPMLTIVELDSSAYLLFTAMWGACDNDLNALRCEIALRIGEPEPNVLRLSFAPITPPMCSALIGDGSGNFETVAKSTTAGMPPYDAVFNLSLRNERLVHVRAGLGGQAGFLAVEYRADLQLPVRAKATFRQVSIDLLSWIRSQQGSGRSLHQLLDEAVERGLASVEVDGSVDQVGQITAGLYDRVIDQVARSLPRWLAQDMASDINVAVTLDQHVNQPIRAFADIGTIVAVKSAQALSGGEDVAN
jgi:hypothetical protein